jgi:hypothetical protein
VIARTRRMTKSEVQARRAHAHSFLQAADLAHQFGDEADIVAKGNTVGSLAVLAGIAAADAVCGALLGERAAGQEGLRLRRDIHRRPRPAIHEDRLHDEGSDWMSVRVG